MPDTQLLQVLVFCCAASSLGAVAATCRALRSVAEDDHLWAKAWRGGLGVGRIGQPPRAAVRAAYLRRLATRCVECREPTDFEHAIVGCRLCEDCEKGCPKYVLVRPGTACQEYHLPLSVLRTLPHADGSTGRVYLRAAVEALAARHHSDKGLQQLRAKHDIGMTACGRQRRTQPAFARPGGPCAREPRDQRRRKVRVDDDPCCFEATALRRANEAAVS